MGCHAASASSSLPGFHGPQPSVIWPCTVDLSSFLAEFSKCHSYFYPCLCSYFSQTHMPWLILPCLSEWSIQFHLLQEAFLDLIGPLFSLPWILFLRLLDTCSLIVSPILVWPPPPCPEPLEAWPHGHISVYLLLLGCRLRAGISKAHSTGHLS